MGKFVYNGDDELVFPTLGLTVNKGDVFEAPDDVASDLVVPATGKVTVSAPVVDVAPVVVPEPVAPVVDPTPVVDATPVAPAPVDAAPVDPATPAPTN